ncbi:MAG: bifunctional aspartate transaminase/aspartate 4-decarboxylase, partial [Muribaculaceae bacterium]|nr:bifunctional aspartate transaminase/aspartate 4-decarboxylase [Muribaculaceae bacterium]
MSGDLKEQRSYEKKLEKMSPFEIKDTLINLASDDDKASTSSFLNAGRGNPNWIATAPREAFFLLGQWAVQEARDETYMKPGIAALPESKGIGHRLRLFLRDNMARRGASLLLDTLDYAENKLGIDSDSLAFEWADGILGDQYPVPPRILANTEKIVAAYMAQEMGNKALGYGKEYDYFATEGGTAAMCYIFDTLANNHLLKHGDSIALMTPIFTPYIEMPELDRYDFHVVDIRADSVDSKGRHTWQFTDEELNKLRDPNIKLLCVVNPSNPPSYKMSDEVMEKLVDIVKKDNPNLMIITDDVYGTFAKDFKSLMYVLPENTICVYSFSKYFGATGWRLAVVATAKENIFDKMISEESKGEKEDLHRRYRSITMNPDKLKFIDRMVADSRSVALNHTAGLSTPQQIQMTLFASMCLLDTEDVYKRKMQSMIKDRLEALWKGAGFRLVNDPLRVGYYSEIDLMVWGEHLYGKDFCEWLKSNYEPLDPVLRLAKETNVVLLNGSGFDGPAWSVRASLANLDENEYLRIGDAIREIID